MKFEIKDQITPAPRKKNNQLWIIVSIVIMLSLVGIIANFTIFKHKAVPLLPAEITSNLNYQTYSSSDNEVGYTYLPGSAKIQTGILFYTMEKTGTKKRIFVTEQAAPDIGVNLKSLPKYTSLDVPIGKAVIGTSLGNPSVVIINSSTILQLSSSKSVTKSEITNVAQKMSIQENSQTQN